MEYVGFALVLIGMSAVESDGWGLVIAIGAMVVGIAMMLLSERRKRK